MKPGARATRRVVLRDLAIFQLKLVIDGLKDVALLQASLIAAAIDLILPGDEPGRLFYRVLALSERFDLWLNLHGAAAGAAAEKDGLFGVSPAGADTLLGRLEQMVRGGDEARTAA